MSEIHHNNSTFSVGDEIELKDIRYRIVKFSMDAEQNVSAVLTECVTSRKSVRRLDRLQQLQQQHSSGKTELPTQPTTTSSSSITRKTGTHTIDTIDKKTSKKAAIFVCMDADKSVTKEDVSKQFTKEAHYEQDHPLYTAGNRTISTKKGIYSRLQIKNRKEI